MPRRPDGDEPRTDLVSFRVTATDLAAIDAARGDRTRSAFIRDLIEAETSLEATS